jgi:hypothetical protein
MGGNLLAAVEFHIGKKAFVALYEAAGFKGGWKFHGGVNLKTRSADSKALWVAANSL